MKITGGNEGFLLTYVFLSKPISYFLSRLLKLFCTEMATSPHVEVSGGTSVVSSDTHTLQVHCFIF